MEQSKTLQSLTKNESYKDLKSWLTYRRVRLDKKLKFLYLPNGKAMSGSIDDLIGLNTGRVIHIKKETNLLIKTLNDIPSEELDKIYKFTVVRNPWDRVVAAYFYLPRNKDIPIISDHSTNAVESFRIRENPTVKDFQNFVKNILNKYGTYCYVDFRNQYDCIYHNSKKIINEIFYFEDMKPLPSFITEKQYPHKRKGSNKKPYSSFYDSETRKIVEKLYSADIEELGYKFEK